MRIFTASAFALLVAIGQAEVFSTMQFTTFNAATSNPNGHTGHFGQATLFVPTSNSDQATIRVNSVTIHGLKAQRPGWLTINMSNPLGSLSLHDSGFGQASVDGNITFIPGDSSNTFLQAIANAGAGAVIGDQTFTPQGRVVTFGVPAIQDYQAFVGGFSGWSFSVINSNTAFGGSFVGISVDADLAPVPEPATFALLAVGPALFGRRRK